MSRVICVLTTKHDFKVHLWQSVDFKQAEEARLVFQPKDFSVLGTALSFGLGGSVEWAVCAEEENGPSPETARRYVIGYQKNHGLRGAPRRYLSWNVHPYDGGHLHVFDLGFIGAADMTASSPGIISVDGQPLVRVQSWPYLQPKSS